MCFSVSLSWSFSHGRSALVDVFYSERRVLIKKCINFVSVFIIQKFVSFLIGRFIPNFFKVASDLNRV